MTPPAVPPRHWVIGDVHGCADALERLAGLLPQRDRLVLCGDVINRGPQIERSMELAWGLVCCGRAVWLQGNHEASLVQALKQQGPGARETLAACETYRQLGDRRCRLWLERLEALPLIYRGTGWVATHAGFDPESWEPSLTVRQSFWDTYDGRFGDVIVAHTPGKAVRRKKRGQIVLIDTGACYGGRLSAYCPETGASRSVAGDRPWFMDSVPQPIAPPPVSPSRLAAPA